MGCSCPLLMACRVSAQSQAVRGQTHTEVTHSQCRNIRVDSIKCGSVQTHLPVGSCRRRKATRAVIKHLWTDWLHGTNKEGVAMKIVAPTHLPLLLPTGAALWSLCKLGQTPVPSNKTLATWHPVQGVLGTSPLTAHPSPHAVMGTLQGTRALSQILMYLWN